MVSSFVGQRCCALIGCSQLALHLDPCLGHCALVTFNHFILCEDLVTNVVLHIDVVGNFVEDFLIGIFGELNFGLHLVISTLSS